jgi:Flp pilus assembly protein TadD
MARIVSLALAAALLAGCAGDPFTASIDPNRPPRADENPRAPQAEAVVRVADSTAEANDFATAASLYRRAHALDPGNFRAAAGLGHSLARLGAHEEAAAAYRAAVRLNGENADALRGLGNALIAMGQPAQALPHLNKALRLREDAGIYGSLGVAHDRLADHGAAQAYYRTGLDVVPDDLTLTSNLALSLSLSGRHADAIGAMRRAAALPGAGLRHYMNLALVLGLAGEIEAAAEIARAHMDAGAAEASVAYYERLRAGGDANAIAEALGIHYAAR